MTGAVLVTGAAGCIGAWVVAERVRAGLPVHVFDLSDDAVAWLADKGYDSRMGARPLARIIQEHIKQPLAEELLFGKLAHGGEVHVSVKDGAMAFELTPAPPKLVKKKTARKAPPKRKPKAQASPDSDSKD